MYIIAIQVHCYLLATYKESSEKMNRTCCAPLFTLMGALSSLITCSHRPILVSKFSIVHVFV